jgi:hypothetical protein
MAVTRIISGGQTGADRGGLDAAIQLGLEHGGWCPKGRRAEDGRIPLHYNLTECDSREYPIRTRKNVAWSDGTIVFTRGPAQGGSRLTIQMALSLHKPMLPVDLDVFPIVMKISAWLAKNKIKILNVAGSRESTASNIQAEVRELLVGSIAVLVSPPRRAAR